MKVWINAINDIVWNPNIDFDFEPEDERLLYWTHSFRNNKIWWSDLGGVWMILK